MVKKLCFLCRGTGSIPGQGTRSCMLHSEAKIKNKKKHYLAKKKKKRKNFKKKNKNKHYLAKKKKKKEKS